MSTMLKHWIITGIVGFCLVLSGCHRSFWVYRVDVQQGNIITPKMRSQVHLGMSRSEVEHVLGHPVLVDTFNHNRYNYVYEFRPGHGCIDNYKLTILFQGNQVVRIIDGK